jgi:hypothetical protein
LRSSIAVGTSSVGASAKQVSISRVVFSHYSSGLLLGFYIITIMF